MANSLKSATFLMESRIADAARGSAGALFDLGVAYSTGSRAMALRKITSKHINGSIWQR